MAPFSFFYRLIMQFRNHLYNIGHKPSFEFDQLVISVGNLSVGGTGKTPFVEYLIRYFLQKENGIQLSTLSRGYGRKTRGFLLADDAATAASIGDEPYQIYRKFQEHISVAVGEDRVLAIPSILLERPDNQVVILDDAYQHRRVKPNFSILLSDYSRPFFKDHVLPAGLLRESRSGAKRADVVMITKCPHDLSDKEQDQIKEQVGRYSDKAVYFTSVAYGEIAGPDDREMKKEVVLLTGIAQPAPFKEYIQERYVVTEHMSFPDHHRFSLKDIQKVLEKAEANEADIITTEKDWVRIMSDPALFKLIGSKLFYLPIQVQFLNEESSFLSHLDALTAKHLGK